VGRTALLLLIVVTLGGCMISEQEGDRTHVNSPHPEEIAFHFDTTFNMGLMIGRSALLLLLAWWIVGSRGKGFGIPGIVIALILVGAAGWLLKVGWDRTSAYRIEVRTDRLHVRIPGQSELDVSWQRIEAIEVEGLAHDVQLAPEQPFWSTRWEYLEIGLDDGSTYDVDLRPLSVEQRGTFWRAITRKADLEPVSAYR